MEVIMKRYALVFFGLFLLSLLAPGCKAVTGGGSGGGGPTIICEEPPLPVYQWDGTEYTGSGVVKFCIGNGENTIYLDVGTIENGGFFKQDLQPVDVVNLNTIADGAPPGLTIEPPDAKCTGDGIFVLLDNTGKEAGELSYRPFSDPASEYMDFKFFDRPVSITGTVTGVYNDYDISIEYDVSITRGSGWSDIKVSTVSDTNSITITYTSYRDGSSMNEYYQGFVWFIDTDSAASLVLPVNTGATPTGAKYQAMLNDSLASMETIVEKTLSYCNPYYLQSIIKSGTVIDIENFSDYFDANATKIVVDGSGSEIEVSLADELILIQNESEQKIPAMLPNISLLEGQEGTCIQDGVMYLLDGSTIDMNTMQGILTLELLQAELRGESIDPVISDFDAVAEYYLKNNNDGGSYSYNSSRLNDANFSLYAIKNGTHTNGNIYYLWDNSITSGHKTALTDAMRDWTTKSSNKVRFIDKSNDIVHVVFSALGLARLRKMKTGALPSNVAGRATVGGGLGIGELILKPGLTDEPLYRTSRHELGHILGLMHEHQRWDRDNYVVMAPIYSFQNAIEYGMNYEKINEFRITPVYGFCFEWLIWKIKTWWGTIKISVPILRYKHLRDDTTRLAYGSTKFDCYSIMLYGNLEAKSTVANSVAGRTIANKEISAADAVLVRQLYQ
jgi:hypothetical protein